MATWSAAGLDTGYVPVEPEDTVGESDVPVPAWCPTCGEVTWPGVRYYRNERLCLVCHETLATVTITTIIKATGTPVA